MALPYPPEEMRALVGRPALDLFLEEPSYPPHLTRRVLDLGCGCGRIARWLLTQTPRPTRYLGLDIHAGMIEWCQSNLAAEAFDYIRQDVANPGLNPTGTLGAAPIPAEDGSFSLIIAISFFTHLIESQVPQYLDEIARVIAADGTLHSTFFLFDKRGFPMMQEFQNALYINADDPTNAVIYDRAWLLNELSERNLAVRWVGPPDIQGFHWHLWIGKGGEHVKFPRDLAPVGRLPPPLLGDPHR